MRIEFGGMSELLKGGECFFLRKIQDVAMRLDHIKVEGCNPIEKSLIGVQPLTMSRFMVQNVPNGSRCFCHGSSAFLSVHLYTSE
ncbi:hypothetical protein KDH_14840 [Dictyobacter sp. S3.2.2.5]|uniref:Uncharacterized protein n=1 Tax=Dictyobacter halimunensis TaxID=3026934 RepID=A0ABQ6FMY4_9CHLR|nr:hypothetical protein KDH_14840 [Dictyobacter sp. S3.2.2.5]